MRIHREMMIPHTDSLQFVRHSLEYKKVNQIRNKIENMYLYLLMIKKKERTSSWSLRTKSKMTTLIVLTKRLRHLMIGVNYSIL